MGNGMGDRLVTPVGYFGNVDMTDIAAVVNHPHVQRLGNTMQLGLDHLLFRRARHTRLEHCISVGHLGDVIVAHLGRYGFDPTWQLPLRVYGLLHDLSHLPFGHMMESEFGVDLDRLSVARLDQPHPRCRMTIRETMRSVGIDDARVQALMEHSVPEHQVIKDRNLGADKLSYVFMDNHYSYLVDNPPRLDALLPNLRYHDGVYGIAGSGARLLYDIMHFYIDLRLHLYGHPTCITLVRIFQKAVEIVREGGELATQDVLLMDDIDLESAIRYSFKDDACEMAKRIRYAEIPPIAAAFQYGKHEGPLAGKMALVRRVPLSFLESFYNASRNPHDLTTIETRLADELGIPLLDVCLPQPPNLKKMYPKDTPIIGPAGVVGSLFERYPKIEGALKRKVNRGVKVYVCAREPHDLAIRGNIDKVHAILDEELAKFSGGLSEE